MKLFQLYPSLNVFQLPHMIEAVGIFPNVSNCMQISMKHITQIGLKFFVVHQKWIKLFEALQKWIKLFEVTQNWMKMFHLAQIWMELLPFDQSWFSLLEFSQFFPIYGNIFNLPKFEWSCPNLPKFH